MDGPVGVDDSIAEGGEGRRLGNQAQRREQYRCRETGGTAH